jgi:hypothetical protein
VARIALDTVPAFPVHYQHPSDRPGTFTTVPTYHVTIPLYVAPRAAPDGWRPTGTVDQDRRFDAVLDTGTPLTVIPPDFWEAWATDADVLAQPPDESAILIAGGPQPGRLARVRLGAVDDEGHWLPAEWTLAILLDGRGENALRVPLVGLHSHFFTRRRRLGHVGFEQDDRSAAVPRWCLEDRPRLLPWS